MDYKIQTVLVYANEVTDALEKENILKTEENTLEQGADSLYELPLYTAELVSKMLIDSILELSSDLGEKCDGCREAFEQTSMVEYVKLHKPFFFKSILLEFQELARLHGVTVAVVWFSTEFAQIAAIAFLTSHGLGHYGALAPFVPLSFVNTGIAIEIKSIQHHRKMKAGYGGRVVKNNAQKVEREKRKGLGLYMKTGIIHTFPTSELTHANSEKISYVVCYKPKFFQMIFGALRFNKKYIYWQKIKRWAKKNDTSEQLFWQTLRDEKIDKQLRCVLYLSYLQKHDTLLWNQFMLDYPNAIRVSDFTNFSHDHSVTTEKSWVYHALMVTNFNSLAAIVDSIPVTLTVREVNDLMERVILPHWARHMKGQGFKLFRNVVKGQKEFKYKTLLIANKEWDARFGDLLKECLGIHSLIDQTN